MPGRLPKDPDKRVRRNKETRRTVTGAAPKPPARPTSYLHDGERVPLLALTKRWWDGYRHNGALTALWEASDWNRLVMLVPIVDQFNRTGNARLMSEIRACEAELLGTVSARIKARVQIDRPPEVDRSTSSKARRPGLQVVA